MKSLSMVPATRSFGLLAFLASTFIVPLATLSAIDIDLPSFPTEPFATHPKRLLELAATTPNRDHSAEILLDDGRYEIDENGRVSRTHWQITRLNSRHGFAQFGIAYVPWSPWHQARPTIRARVILADGSVHELDPKTIEESSVRSPDTQVFTDVKALRAPLPALEVGCVVETLTKFDDRTPLSESGSDVMYMLGNRNAPTRLVRLNVFAPKSLRVNARVVGCDLKPTETVTGNQRHVRVIAQSMPAHSEFVVSHLPGSMSTIPQVFMSTAESWNDVAREYHNILESQLRGTQVAGLVNTILGSDRSQPLLIAEKLLQYVHRRTRYTGVFFGNASIVPRRPKEVLSRGYGDCKDLSTLYVALLRAAGIEAKVALVRSGDTIDTLPDVPYLMSFNHAIVVIPGETDIWVDPTAFFLSPGQLPPLCQGRWALVVDDETESLTKTHQDRSKDNQFKEKTTVTINTDGTATLVWKTERSGNLAAGLRRSLASATERQFHDWLRHQAMQRFGTDQLQHAKFSQPLDLKRPLRLEATFRAPGTVQVGNQQALVAVSVAPLLHSLPLDLTGLPDASAVASNDRLNRRRQTPLALPLPFQYRSDHHIISPAGFELTDSPPPMSLDVGDLGIRVQTTTAADRTTITALMDTGDGRFSAAEARTMRDKIEAITSGKGYAHWQLDLRFLDESASLAQQGESTEVVQHLRSLLASNPKDAMRHAQLANYLCTLGLTDLAREHAAQAVHCAPNDSYAHYSVAHVAAHDRVGNFCGLGMNRAKAVQAYQQALALDLDHDAARLEYANLLEFDESSIRYGNSQGTRAAISQYRKLAEKHKDNETILDLLASAMCFDEQFRELKDLLETRRPSPLRNLYLTASVAATDGVERCMATAIKLERRSFERNALITATLELLDNVRQYDLARDLAKRSAENSKNSQNREYYIRYAKALEGLSKYEHRRDPQTLSAEELVRTALATAFLRGPRSKQLISLFCNLPHHQHDIRLQSELPVWVVMMHSNYSVASSVPAIRFADMVSQFDITTSKTTGSLHYVRAVSRAVPSLAWDVIVEDTKEGPRLVYAGDGHSEVGARCIKRIKEGKWDEARMLLAWVFKDEKKSLGWFNQFSGSPFARLWITGRGTKTEISLAAAALAAHSSAAEDALAILTAKRVDGPRQLQVDRAICLAGLMNNDRDTIDHIAETYTEPAWREQFLVCQLMLASQRRDWADFDDLFSKLTDEDAKTFARITLMRTAIEQNDSQRLESALDSLKTVAKVHPADFKGHVATGGLLTSPIAPEFITLAQEAFEEVQDAPPEDWRKLMGVTRGPYLVSLCEEGRFADAADALRVTTSLESPIQARNIECYVQGRIAEACGFEDHARELYGRTKQLAENQPSWVDQLARRRISAAIGNTLADTN